MDASLRKEEIKQRFLPLRCIRAQSIDAGTFVEKLSIYAGRWHYSGFAMSAMIPDYVSTRTFRRWRAIEFRLLWCIILQKRRREIKDLLFQPTGKAGKVLEVVVVHENRGLKFLIFEDGKKNCRCRVLLSIWLLMLWHHWVGCPGNDDDAEAMQSKRDRDEMLEDLFAAYEYLKNHPRLHRWNRL